MPAPEAAPHSPVHASAKGDGATNTASEPAGTLDAGRAPGAGPDTDQPTRPRVAISTKDQTMPKRIAYQTEIEYLQILDEHGNFDAELGADTLSDEDVLFLYEQMSIVRHYAERADLDLEALGWDDVRADALRWALERGSRSGRVAHQFVDDLAGRVALESKPGR